MKIGKIIHYYRKKNNMTQEELAFRLGVSGATISKWENNLSYPETSLLPKISDIFDISINQLFNNDFVLVSIIDNIIDDVNDPKKYDLQNAILYLEKSLLEYPENENLEFEIAKKYFLLFRKKPNVSNDLIKKSINIFEKLINSKNKDISQWSKHFLSLIYSRVKDLDNAFNLNKQLMLAEGINPKLDNIIIKFNNGYIDIDKDIKINLISLLEEYFTYWKYLYEYYYKMQRYEDILIEGLKYISVIINYIGKDKSIFFKQLSYVYYDLGIAYYKVNNKMRSDECFISSLLYAKKYDELDREIIDKFEKNIVVKEKKSNCSKLEEIKALIENNEEKEIKDKLTYFLTRIKF